MGPLATVDFYAKLVRLTPAHADRDHLRVIIDSNPKIPDRTAGLTGEGPDPTPALVATARGLERAGADLIAIPCNSAHAYLPAIRSAVAIPVLDIMHEVAAAVATFTPRPRAVGLLATPGTIRAGLYHRALAAHDIGVVDCSEEEERDVLGAIKAVKGGDLGPRVRQRAGEVAAALIARGAGAVVLGCTEIPWSVSPGGRARLHRDPIDFVPRAGAGARLRRHRNSGRRRGPRCAASGRTPAPGISTIAAALLLLVADRRYLHPGRPREGGRQILCGRIHVREEAVDASQALS